MNKFVRNIICLFIVFLICAIFFSKRNEDEGVFYKSNSDTLNCVILLDSRLSSYQGRGVGFSYELLQHYGEESGKTINIYPSDNNVWSKLGNEVSMIVIDSLKTPIPEEYSDDIEMSIHIMKNLVVLVNKEDRSLLNNLNFWLSSFMKTRVFERMCVRFFRSYNLQSIMSSTATVTTISPYDDLMKKYGKFVDIDWLLIAAITYQESQYYLGVRSSQGAQGLMQLKPSTAVRYGVEDLLNPELNIKAGTLHFKYLYDLYDNEGLDSLNVIKFALAAYNAGEARFARSRQFVLESGFNPNDWDSVVEAYSGIESYMSKQTIQYVNDIVNRYEEYKLAIEINDEGR